MVDFRLIIAGSRYAESMRGARRDAKAAKAFLKKAIERVRLHRPVTICTDKAQAYRRPLRRRRMTSGDERVRDCTHPIDATVPLRHHLRGH